MSLVQLFLLLINLLAIIRGDTIQIFITYRKKRYFKTLKEFRPTKTNLALASKMRQEALNRIALGEFDLDEFLGVATNNADTEQNDSHKQQTFFDIASQYLKSIKHRVSEWHCIGELKRLNKYWIPYLGDTAINQIRYSLLVETLEAQHHLAAKTKNLNLSTLRNIFAFATNDGLITENVALKIKPFSMQKPDPEPFTEEEALQIVDYMKQHYEPIVARYYEFAFFTGMRPCEINALRWDDIDFKKRIATVDKGLAIKTVKNTKTNRVRYVELNHHVMQCLEEVKQYTHAFKQEIFIHPLTGRPFDDYSSKIKRNAWRHTLKALGLKHRVSYQARHTYATMYLMHGANHMWVAKQLGHTVATLCKHYTKWINQSRYSDVDLIDFEDLRQKCVKPSKLNSETAMSLAKTMVELGGIEPQVLLINIHLSL